jgi:hypothetical protein
MLAAFSSSMLCKDVLHHFSEIISSQSCASKQTASFDANITEHNHDVGTRLELQLTFYKQTRQECYVLTLPNVPSEWL